jgi:prolyl-tRNA editing enzyme YbaK/EbsC (Cys-tRNA(Pro) deacylase)
MDMATEAVPDSGPARVQRLLDEMGIASEVVRFDASTRTAAEAAAAIGCTVAQIAKSLIFKGGSSGGHILVIASGINRANEQKVAAAIGEGIRKADAEFVRERTGYVIGGVAPIGHAIKPRHTLIDASLAALDPLWAAAGHPHAVFRANFADLVRLTGGRVTEIA